MTPHAFVKAGNGEGVKGATHALACGLLGVMAVYNIVAWCFRRQRHLGINAVLYTAGALYEVKQTARHFGSR